jgi:hypothetical protein
MQSPVDASSPELPRRFYSSHFTDGSAEALPQISYPVTGNKLVAKWEYKSVSFQLHARVYFSLLYRKKSAAQGAELSYMILGSHLAPQSLSLLTCRMGKRMRPVLSSSQDFCEDHTRGWLRSQCFVNSSTLQISVIFMAYPWSLHQTLTFLSCVEDFWQAASQILSGILWAHETPRPSILSVQLSLRCYL